MRDQPGRSGGLRVAAALLVIAVASLIVADGPIHTGIASARIDPQFEYAPTPVVEPSTPVVPRRIAIPTLGVYAVVVPVGVDDSGGVAVPEDIAQIGWYDRSVPIGTPKGSTVLVGHRDAAVDGAGAFYGLERLGSGDRIFVAGAGGAIEFRVADVMLVRKSEFERVRDEIFSNTGDSRLTLVSCGGDFNYEAHSYVSNVIVTAFPAR